MGRAVELSRRRFTADEYHQMLRVGILRERDPFELIDGEVVRKMTIGPRHAAVVNRLTRHFTLACRDAAIVNCQGPVSLDLFNEPEPDLTVLRPREDFYETAHAGPSDILLVVEVAESSIRYDSTVKAELYARLGLVEYWLVDVNAEVVTRFTEPVDGQYRRIEPRARRRVVLARSAAGVPCHDGRHLRLKNGDRGPGIRDRGSGFMPALIALARFLAEL